MRLIASVYKRTKSIMSGNINYILLDSSLLKKEGNSESMVRMAVSVGRDQLASVGTCFGKFTKTGKFKLHITALDYLAQYAKVRELIRYININKANIIYSTRSGSNQMVKCLFFMVIISSKLIQVELQMTHLNTLVLSFFPCLIHHW